MAPLKTSGNPAKRSLYAAQHWTRSVHLAAGGERGAAARSNVPDQWRATRPGISSGSSMMVEALAHTLSLQRGINTGLPEARFIEPLLGVKLENKNTVSHSESEVDSPLILTVQS